MREHFNTEEILYPDGGKLIVEVWLIDGKPNKTFKLPWTEWFRPKEGMEGEVAYKVFNGRDRPLHDVWQEIQNMIEPAE